MPLGFLLAVLYWSIPIATIFPPGAIMVAPKTSNFMDHSIVPTFNASDVGRGDVQAISAGSLFQAQMSFWEMYDGNWQLQIYNT